MILIEGDTVTEIPLAKRAIKIKIGEMYKAAGFNFVTISVSGINEKVDRDMQNMCMASGDTISINWDMVKTVFLRDFNAEGMR